MEQDEKWMRLALEQAMIAYSCDEVPVGALVVANQELVALGHNQPIASNRPTAHAEIMALESACKKRQNYRLPNCVLYVTLEPCIMCVGAILQARIGRLVFAAREPKTGAVCSQHQLLHKCRIDWRSGVLAEESSLLLKNFFLQRRLKNR